MSVKISNDLLQAKKRLDEHISNNPKYFESYKKATKRIDREMKHYKSAVACPELIPCQEGALLSSQLLMLTLWRSKPEYFEIVDGRTLMPVDTFNDSDFIVACTAVWAGDVRLIDNMILKN